MIEIKTTVKLVRKDEMIEDELFKDLLFFDNGLQRIFVKDMSTEMSPEKEEIVNKINKLLEKL